MSKKPRYFIYESKEVAVLLTLALSVSVFAFTLGVHLGKRVGPKDGPGQMADALPATTTDESTPDRVGLTEQSEGVEEAITESLDTALEEEVKNTGIELKVKKQVDLPSKAKTKNAAATNTATKPKAEVKTEEPAKSSVFALQIGSFPSKSEAEAEIKALTAKGAEPFMRQMTVKGKGEWFRVYLGGFQTKKEAEEGAEKLVRNQLIRNYIVAKIPKSNDTDQNPEN